MATEDYCSLSLVVGGLRFDCRGAADRQLRKRFSDHRANDDGMGRCQKSLPDKCTAAARTLRENLLRDCRGAVRKSRQCSWKRFCGCPSPDAWSPSGTVALVARLPGRDATHRTRILDTHLTHGCIQHFRHFLRVRSGCALPLCRDKHGDAPVSEGAQCTLKGWPL